MCQVMDDCHAKQSEDILLIIYWEKYKMALFLLADRLIFLWFSSHSTEN